MLDIDDAAVVHAPPRTTGGSWILPNDRICRPRVNAAVERNAARLPKSIMPTLSPPTPIACNAVQAPRPLPIPFTRAAAP